MRRGREGERESEREMRRVRRGGGGEGRKEREREGGREGEEHESTIMCFMYIVCIHCKQIYQEWYIHVHV